MKKQWAKLGDIQGDESNVPLHLLAHSNQFTYNSLVLRKGLRNLFWFITIIFFFCILAVPCKVLYWFRFPYVPVQFDLSKSN